MGSYILIPILILLVLVIFLPHYLEDYFLENKKEELASKGQLVSKIVQNNNQQELNDTLSDLEELVDTSIIVINQQGKIINQGRQMNRMMKMHGRMKSKMGDHSDSHRGMMNHNSMMNRFQKELLDLEDGLDQVLAGKTVTFQGKSPMLGQSIIAVGIPIEVSPRLALFLISPSRGLQEMVVKIRNLTLQITLGAIILALGLGYFISRGITRPLEKMKIQARKMAAGNFDEKLTDLPGDEIGKLGASFNYMSEQLAKNITALDAEKSRMEEMLTSMTEGVLGVTADKKIMLANPKLKEIFNLKQDIINHKFNSHCPTELVTLVEEVLAEESEASREFDWQEQIIAAQAAPVQVGSKLWGVIILVRDVTEIRKLDQMRRLFVANVSHELKTPLTAVQGYLEAILDGVVEQEKMQRDYLQRVLSETERMSNLVADILDLSRLQSGQVDFNWEQVDLIKLIKSVKINLESRLEKREVILNTPAKLVLETDKNKLEEVLVNLLSNAIKFTDPDGKIEIKVLDQAQEVTVEIIDDGLGIPEAEQNYIWERFHQVDRARKPAGEGTGLGLAIVKEIIESLGGKIRVESELEVGTDFIFSLPYRENQ